MTLRPAHNGVLVPDDLLNAATQKLDAYAAKVKAGNSAFCAAVFALEDRAAELGLSLDGLES